jgi:hypothetical protein
MAEPRRLARIPVGAHEAGYRRAATGT